MPRRPVCRVVARATFVAFRQPTGRARRGPLQVAFVPIPAPDGRPQVAYVVSKRCGGAVERNRIRRRLRHAVDQLAQGLVPGAYLIRTQPTVIDLDFDELIHNLEDCLAHASSDGRDKRD